MLHSLGTAAKLVGVSRTTVLRAIKSGKISANREGKNYLIDESELRRGFHEEIMKQNTRNSLKQHEASDGTLETAVTLAELNVLKEQLTHQLEREKEHVRDLQRRLDESERERKTTQERLTALLTHQIDEKTEAASKPKERKSLFEKIFGK